MTVAAISAVAAIAMFGDRTSAGLDLEPSPSIDDPTFYGNANYLDCHEELYTTCEKDDGLLTCHWPTQGINDVFINMKEKKVCFYGRFPNCNAIDFEVQSANVSKDHHDGVIKFTFGKENKAIIRLYLDGIFSDKVEIRYMKFSKNNFVVGGGDPVDAISWGACARVPPSRFFVNPKE